MDDYTLDALNHLLNYVYDDEEKGWQSLGQPKEHIFTDILVITEWVDKELVERHLI